MNLKPQGVGAKIDFVRPFEASSPLPDLDFREEHGIPECRKDSFTDQMVEAVDGRIAVRPGDSEGAGTRVGDGGDDNIIEYLGHS
jgi:hypothetical protein